MVNKTYMIYPTTPKVYFRTTCEKLKFKFATHSSLVVFVSISKLGLTDLIFVCPEWVKINGGYYRDMLLSQQLWPVMCDVSGYFLPFNKTAHLHHWHVTQHPLSFLQIYGRGVALTLIWSITRYGVIPAVSASVTAAQHWQTEKVFARRLSWHEPESHWRCNWWEE